MSFKTRGFVKSFRERERERYRLRYRLFINPHQH
jgi:hypothetical protein